ncbi:MAG: N-acetylmuramoyl-L-alanine amidase [Bacteroidales bacterium]|nr:N-acetylmuramoyl-L-alanine amidase [Bacteroidales bacterium]MDD4670415.1 N-acetylmuramoyl-L-alanine amidase [Bacteroidales bacterium]
MPFGLNRFYFVLIFLFPVLVISEVQAQNDNMVTLKTVVIDAGHGGYDPGSLSPDKKTKEKDITLDIALKLGDRINAAYPNINVIYTRSRDIYIPLAERSTIANKNHADLFISVHVNSVKGTTAPNGTETFIMGADKSKSNMEVCKTENSVILLEEDYTTTYQGYDPDDPESFIFFNLMQNAHFEHSILFASLIQDNLSKGPIYKNRGIKQAPLLVLWKTTMPSVLVEVGFISNSSDRKSLTNAKKRNEIAMRLFDAFVMFKKQYESSGIVATDTVQKGIEPDSKVERKTEIAYKIQIFATAKKVKDGSPEFKNVKEYSCVYVKGLYKYLVGNYTSKDEAQRELSKYRLKFNGAFIVKVDSNGNIL